jgi:hypothetical protein
MNGFRTWDVEELVHELSLHDWGEPVRLMEALLARGEAAVAPLVEVVEGSGAAPRGGGRAASSSRKRAGRRSGAASERGPSCGIISPPRTPAAPLPR